MKEFILDFLGAKITVVASILGILATPVLVLLNYWRIQRLRQEIENKSEEHSLQIQKLQLEIQKLEKDLSPTTRVVEASLEEILRFGRARQEIQPPARRSDEDQVHSFGGPEGCLALPLLVVAALLPGAVLVAVLVAVGVGLLGVGIYQLYVQGILATTGVGILLAASALASLFVYMVSYHRPLRLRLVRFGQLDSGLVDAESVALLKKLRDRTLPLYGVLLLVAYPFSFNVVLTFYGWLGRELTLLQLVLASLALDLSVLGLLTLAARGIFRD